MRFTLFLLALFLASCATPKTVPQSYYSGTFLPGSVSIGEQGEFVSTAGTFDENEISTARKAAFSRLMSSAKNGGYNYFQIDSENTTKVIGHRFTVRGILYKSRQGNDNVFPVAAIERLLNGQTLVAPKPVYRAPKPAMQQVRAPVEVPSTEEPLVIMAPTDITGSINKAEVPSGQPLVLKPVSHSVSSIPTGVVLQTR
jgi:hypothetical protein